MEAKDETEIAENLKLNLSNEMELNKTNADKQLTRKENISEDSKKRHFKCTEDDRQDSNLSCDHVTKTGCHDKNDDEVSHKRSRLTCDKKAHSKFLDSSEKHARPFILDIDLDLLWIGRMVKEHNTHSDLM